MVGNAGHPEGDGPEQGNWMVDVKGILEALHESGLAVEITWDGPGSIELTLGQPIAGEVASTDIDDEIFTLAEAVLWLRDRACRHFPDSDFALKYRNRAERPGAINTPGTRWARLWGCTCPEDQPKTGTDRCTVDPRCPAHGFI
jgi:hypothetical protein